MLKGSRTFAVSVVALACSSPLSAATPINLSHQSATVLNSFASSNSGLSQISEMVDFNKVTHLRFQQTYRGHNVWGADGVAHISKTSNVSIKSLLAGPKSNTTMNGILYQNLDADLANTPSYVFESVQANKALQQAVQTYQTESGINKNVTDAKTDLMVYVDQANKAHWIYLVEFTAQTATAMPAKPVFIMDAVNFKVYQTWNNLQTLGNAETFDSVEGGGFGGNEKMGEMSYDSLPNDLPMLSIERDAENNICYLENADVTVKDRRANDEVSQFDCAAIDGDHNNIYWDADFDKVNGGYSPSNDALFIGKVVKEMYQNWYGLPVLTEANGKPMMLNMRVHEFMDNAYWDGKQMTFGDGIVEFYPLVSLGVGAHEISHGFTMQHSSLKYYGQSGGLNESFSDMAVQAGEYYAYGNNNWQIAPEIFKAENEALRYMDQPSKDCKKRKPGQGCSIDTFQQYTDNLDVHYSSGLFNHIFYLLGTANNWDTRKAFDVMVKANMNYWTSKTTFADAACGVVKATRDYNYDMDGVTLAMAAVGIDTSNC